MLRAWGSGAFTIRFRPHFVLGYVALAGALVHVVLSMPAASAAGADGIRFATIATVGLGAQAFIGTNLQSPGTYRRPLRRWHTALFWVIAACALLHIALNGPFPGGG
jgi:hypothetical protein